MNTEVNHIHIITKPLF